MLTRTVIQGVLVSILSFLCLPCALGTEKEEDLYALLGVDKTATLKAIKSAYRRKALDTHPDKNHQSQSAAEEFIRVTNAFQVLTDEATRRTYDSTGSWMRTTASEGFNAGSFNTAFEAWFLREHGFSLSEARQVQSRTVQIVSLQQLRAIILDDNDTLEMHLVMIFVTPNAIEKTASDKLFFPYPFGLERNVQAVQVRYHRENELTNYFGIAHGDALAEKGQPVVVFGEQGKMLSAELERLETNDRVEFQAWVWQQLETEVTISNRHSHSVDIYWVQNQRAAKLVATGIAPGERRVVRVSESQDLWFRDTRVDSFQGAPRKQLSRESMLMIHTVSRGEKEIVVHHVACLDLSYQCSVWSSQHGCENNSHFMQEFCPRSCSSCEIKDSVRLEL